MESLDYVFLIERLYDAEKLISELLKRITKSRAKLITDGPDKHKNRVLKKTAQANTGEKARERATAVSKIQKPRCASSRRLRPGN